MTNPYDTSSPTAEVPNVVRGTHEDVAEILRWLKAEFDVDHDGFWHNRNIVERAVDDEELWVIREDGLAVAFLVGNYAPDILNVRQDRQRRGLGEALFAASLARAEAADVVVLNITCMPPTSLPFWRRMGFEPSQGRLLARSRRWSTTLLPASGKLLSAPEIIPMSVAVVTIW